MDIFVIKGIRAQRANIQQTNYLVAPVPVFAAVMLGHAVAARLGKRDLGVGIIHHSCESHIEHIPNKKDKKEWLEPHPCQFRGATGDIASRGGGPTQNSIQPSVTGDLHVSLILAIESGASIDDVRRVVETMGVRLAGGKVVRQPAVLEAEDLWDGIRQCGRGYWVSDANAVVRERLDKGMSIVQAVLGPVPGGWYVPATLGYRALTRFEQRGGARDGLDHAYGEPVVGLVRYQSVFSLRDQGQRPTLWSHAWVTDSLFLVRQP
jgi:CRISPR-associated protein Csy2